MNLLKTKVFGFACLGLLLVLNNACSERDEAAQAEAKVHELTDKSNKPNESKKKVWRVMDSFNVGDNVFVRSLAIEEDKNILWVGTSVGVLEIDLTTQEVKNTFTRKDGLANEYVFAIGIDKDGYKWFGTNGGGVSRYKDGKWKTYFPM
ncbi:Sensor histidine kinase/response regulator, partial [hydrothermal vent metagenome]